MQRIYTMQKFHTVMHELFQMADQSKAGCCRVQVVSLAMYKRNSFNISTAAEWVFFFFVTLWEEWV